MRTPYPLPVVTRIKSSPNLSYIAKSQVRSFPKGNISAHPWSDQLSVVAGNEIQLAESAEGNRAIRSFASRQLEKNQRVSQSINDPYSMRLRGATLACSENAEPRVAELDSRKELRREERNLLDSRFREERPTEEAMAVKPQESVGDNEDQTAIWPQQRKRLVQHHSVAFSYVEPRKSPLQRCASFCRLVRAVRRVRNHTRERQRLVEERFMPKFKSVFLKDLNVLVPRVFLAQEGNSLLIYL
jgi:hypothetical protein